LINKKLNKNCFFIDQLKGFGAETRLASFARKRSDFFKNQKDEEPRD
jgi:hypothetical protein